MSLKKTPIHCPICKTSVARESEAFPFCSPRCQTIDLGNWASDAYNISDHSSEDDVFEQNDGVHQENRTVH